MRFEEFVLQMWYLHRDEAALYNEPAKTLDEYAQTYYDWLMAEFQKAKA